MCASLSMRRGIASDGRARGRELEEGKVYFSKSVSTLVRIQTFSIIGRSLLTYTASTSITQVY